MKLEFLEPLAEASPLVLPSAISSSSGPTFAPSSAPLLLVRPLQGTLYACPQPTLICCLDQYLGKFKTIIASTPIYVAGMIILVTTSTPVAIQSGASMGGLVTAMITIGLGTGGLKACIAPMCGEQTPILKSYIQINKKTSEREVVSAPLTSARVFMWYYWAANLGSLSGLATTSLEKVHSFWVGFLLPLL